MTAEPLLTHAGLLAWETRMGFEHWHCAADALGFGRRSYERYHYGRYTLPEPAARLALALEETGALVRTNEAWRETAKILETVWS